MTGDDRLTTANVAALIRKSQRTVIRFIESGKLPIAERLNVGNGLYLIYRRDAEALRAQLEDAEVSA